MAKAIDWNPFGPWSNTLSWGELFDGRVWEIRRGEDFDLAVSTIAKQIRDEHTRLYGMLLLKEDGDIIRVQRVAGLRDAKDQ
jgi:hypothetical protein